MGRQRSCLEVLRIDTKGANPDTRQKASLAEVPKRRRRNLRYTVRERLRVMGNNEAAHRSEAISADFQLGAIS